MSGSCYNEDRGENMKKSVFSYVASVLVFILVFLSVCGLFASVSNQLYGVVDHSTSNLIGIVQWMVLLLLVVPLDLALCIRLQQKLQERALAKGRLNH